MRSFRKIGLLIIILIVVFQFVQPEKNVSEEGIGPSDISRVYAIPEDLHRTLVRKCYDCHSNNTHYPWYAHVQPIGWWLAAHIHEGKQHLNFSEFATYKADRAAHKLEELAEVTHEGSMPLDAYVMLHPDSKLTEEDKKQILSWLNWVQR